MLTCFTPKLLGRASHPAPISCVRARVGKPTPHIRQKRTQKTAFRNKRLARESQRTGRRHKGQKQQSIGRMLAGPSGSAKQHPVARHAHDSRPSTRRCPRLYRRRSGPANLKRRLCRRAQTTGWPSTRIRTGPGTTPPPTAQPRRGDGAPAPCAQRLERFSGPLPAEPCPGPPQMLARERERE
jgi:hypothetical protein